LFGGAPSGRCVRHHDLCMEIARSDTFSRHVAVLLTLGLLCAPWLVPLPWSTLRLLVGLLGWLAITKTADLLREAPRDPKTRSSVSAFALWCLMPAKVRWPDNDVQRASTRRLGLRRMLRGLLKVGVLVGLLALPVLWPALRSHVLLHSLWGLCVCYCVFSGGIDLGTSLPMCWGIHVDEIFDAPFVATSPRDFWGTRWNKWVQRFLRREVFMPLRRKPAVAVLAVFLLSGLAHEYLAIAALGTSRGQMLGFFLLQGLALLLTWRLPRPRSVWTRFVGWALHTAWLVTTGPLFLEPVFRAAPIERLAWGS